ncbi:MAG: hypothetical protein WEB58_12915 [Planctomycetaceae bacterium]
MIDQPLRMLFESGEKVLAFHFQFVIDKGVQLPIVPNGKISLENDSIKAAEQRYNGRGKRIQESKCEFHSVLRRLAV